MKIAFIVNNATYTSIPIEVANLLSEKENVSILSLYDDQKTVVEVCKQVAPQCCCAGFNYKHNRKLGKKLFRRALMEGDYDIVHTHQTFSGSLTRWLLRNSLDIKVFHTVHANHNSFGLRQNVLIGSTFPFCDCLIFNSESSLNGLKRWQKTLSRKVPSKVIYNGINVTRIQNADNTFAREFCTKNGITENTFLFAQIGRLEPVKNPILSLQAFHQFIMNKPHKDACFVFVGDGSQRLKLEEYVSVHPEIKDRVFFAGTIARDDVYSFLHRVDAMIVPSLYEGFCNVLFEGLSAGVPIIASDIEVFRELIDKNMCVHKFSRNSVDDLVHKMNEIMETPPSVTEIECSKRVAYERFDVSKCVNNYLNAYREILSGGKDDISN